MRERAIPEIVHGRVYARVYDNLPLEGVILRYEAEIVKRGDSVRMDELDNDVFICDQIAKYEGSHELDMANIETLWPETNGIAVKIAEQVISDNPGEWEAFAGNLTRLEISESQCDPFMHDVKCEFVYGVKIKDNRQPNTHPGSEGSP